MPRHRTEKVNGDFVQCPYCKESFHNDTLLDLEWEERKKSDLNRMDGANGLVTKMLESKKSAP